MRNAASKSASISIPPWQGIKVAIGLFWMSLLAFILRRDGVTFYVEESYD